MEQWYRSRDERRGSADQVQRAGQRPQDDPGREKAVHSGCPGELARAAPYRESEWRVPGKGALLTTLSAYWFSILPPLVPELKTHFLTLDLPAKLKNCDVGKDYEGRSMQVRRLEVLPIESIVRGYITGSAWSEYQKSGTVHEMDVGAGLKESEAFPEPLWTPSTKAEMGEHDENITPMKG